MRERPVARAGRRGFLTLFALWSLFPLYWLVTMSLKKPLDTLAIPPRWLFAPVVDAYVDAWNSAPLVRYLVNSLVVAAVATGVGLLAGVLGGYALTRLRGRWVAHFEFWVLSSRMAPPVAVALPYFVLYRKAGMQDTLWGLALVHIVLVLGLITWVMTETFRGLPRELEEAAYVDGATPWGVFRRISLPLARPGVIAAGVLAFLFSWNEFFLSLVLTNEQAKTAPVGVFTFIGYQSIQLNQLAAASTLLLVPAFLVVLLFQRRLVAGLTLGAVKG
jgi:multiple sugar transport system permease protein